VRRRTAAGTAALAGLALLASGCLPAAATEQASAVRDLWSQFLVAAAAVGGLVWGLITVAILRYRRRRSETGLPPQIHDSRALEIAWTTGPILIVAILFALTMGTLDRVNATTPGALTVEVTAFRWQWRFDYPASGVTVTGGPAAPAEMVVPVGEPVRIVLRSADVAHAFFVPAFLFKRDAIPGRTTEFELTLPAEDAGQTYRGQCAEFCGVFHDRMLLSVRAVTRADFDAWLASRPAGSPGAGASGSPPPSAGASGVAP
jgi:cytochrome c oxidase subunit 2